MKTNKQAAYTVTQFTGQTGFFLVHNRPMGGKFILAKFDGETTEEGRNMVANACNGHAALVAYAKTQQRYLLAKQQNASEQPEEFEFTEDEAEELDTVTAALALATA